MPPTATHPPQPIFAALDIGGTKIDVLIVDDRLQTRAQLTRPTPTGSRAALCDGVVAALDAALDAAGAAATALTAIGIGAPGQVDTQRGAITLAVNLRLDAPLALGPYLAARYGCPVALENDVRLAALGAFHFLYADRGVRDLAYVGVGTGVAAGLVLGGSLHRGVRGMAGEIGQMTLPGGGDSAESLEHAIAGPGITRRARALGLDVADAGGVYRRAAGGDPVAAALVGEVAALTATAVQWLILTYDVDVVVLGGGVTRPGDAYLQPLLDALARLAAASPAATALLGERTVALTPAGFNAGLWGAIWLAQSRLPDAPVFVNHHEEEKPDA